MFFILSFVTLLRVLPAVLSATVPAADSSVVEAKTLVVNGREIGVVTVPVPAAVLAAARNNATRTASSLTKRVTNNACLSGCPVVTCTNDLSSSPTAPTSGDCANLTSAINELAYSELTPAYPCNFANPDCPNFSVLPGYERQYTLGTCLAGFINLNPIGGPTLSFCDYLMGGTTPFIYSHCVTTAGNTGGYCISPENGFLYGIEVRHS